MKNITCFTANLASGGAEHQMAILCNFLAERDYNITLVTYNDLPDEYELDSRITRVILDKSKNRVAKQLMITNYFLHAKIDCLISYRSTPNFVVLVPMLFRKNIKVICGERNITIAANVIEKINYNLLYRRANYIVPNSHTQANYLKKLGKSWGNRVVPIINYTDIDKYLPSSIPENSDNELLIGVFARIFPQKNYERICKMLQILKKKTNRKFKIIWYGERKEMEHTKGSNHIHSLIKELCIEDVIEIRPNVTDVEQKIKQFHFMCLPSLYEGFSNSLAEYICSGKPVVCSDVSDNSLMVHEGENGFLFNPKDIDSMCNAFLKVLELNIEQMKEMGLKSRMIAEQLFDKELFINSYINLIED